MTGRRLAALLVAVGGAAGLGLTPAAGRTAANAAPPRTAASLSLSPTSGTSTQVVTALYSRGSPCGRGSLTGSWDGYGLQGSDVAYVTQVDQKTCTYQLGIYPPQSQPGLTAVGDHVVTVSTSAGVAGGAAPASATYTVTAVVGGPPGGGGSTQVPAPITVPTQVPAPPPPTPTPTPQPITAIVATFPPHDCADGIPDGPTACPNPNGAAVAVFAPSTAPPAATVRTTASGSLAPAVILGVLAGLILLLVVAIALGWRTGGMRARSARAMSGDDDDPPPPPPTRGPVPPPPSAPGSRGSEGL